MTSRSDDINRDQFEGGSDRSVSLLATIEAIRKEEEQKLRDGMNKESRKQRYEQINACLDRSLENVTKCVRQMGGATRAAARLVLSKGTVGEWIARRNTSEVEESKKLNRPSLENLVKLSVHTGYSVDWLCGFDVLPERDHHQSITNLEIELYKYVVKALRRTGCPDGEIACFLSKEAELMALITEACRSRISLRRDEELDQLETHFLATVKKTFTDDTITGDKARALLPLLAVLDSDENWIQHFDKRELQPVFFNDQLPSSVLQTARVLLMRVEITKRGSTVEQDDKELDGANNDEAVSSVTENLE
jgi:hypothetical protein